jgi:RNA polymerase sigma-70 factor (ECF subfamily)
MEKIMDTSNPSATLKCWVDLYSDKMFTWAFHKTSNRETAEDLVQDTFLSAFQSLGKFEGKSEPQTWLFAILNNKIAEYFRKMYRQNTINATQAEEQNSKSLLNNLFDADGSWTKEQQPKTWETEQTNLLDDADFIKIFQSCMGNLPDNWLAAIQLKYLDDKKGELICQELEITPTNFWQILHRSKLQLRKCLEIHWFKK